MLVVGGVTSDLAESANIEVYDLKTGAFRVVGSLSHRTDDLAAVRLADGRVLLLAGIEEPSRTARSSVPPPLGPS